MHWGKEHTMHFVGKFVHCHSVYGMHEGLVHRALRDGIILVHHVQLAGGESATKGEFEAEAYHSSDGPDYAPTQFLFPGPGMFIPYGGIYGLWPRPGLWI